MESQQTLCKPMALAMTRFVTVFGWLLMLLTSAQRCSLVIPQIITFMLTFCCCCCCWWCDDKVQRAGGIWGKSHHDPKRSIWDFGFWEKTIDGVSQQGRLVQKPTLCVCVFFLGGPNYTSRYPLMMPQLAGWLCQMMSPVAGSRGKHKDIDRRRREMKKNNQNVRQNYLTVD